MIITAVRAAVATSRTAPSQPSPCQRAASWRAFGLEHLEHVGERLVEAGHALVLEGAADVVHVHPGLGQPVLHRLGVADPAVDGAGEGPVVFEGGDGRLGQGVDRVGPDEAVDIQGVGVGGVLGRRRRPQRPLRLGAPGGQPLPPPAGETVAEQPVGQLGLGDRGLAPQRQRVAGADDVQATVDLGVDPADKERGPRCAPKRRSPPPRAKVSRPER